MQLHLRVPSLAAFSLRRSRAAALTAVAFGIAIAIRAQLLLPERAVEGGVLYGVAATAFVAGLWRLVSPPVVPALGSPGRVQLGRLRPLALTVGLAAAALILFAKDISPNSVIALWAGSLIGAIAVAWWLDRGRDSATPGLSWTLVDWALLAGLVALASFFRLWHLDYLPGVVGDEAPHVEYAYLVRDGTIATPFQEGYWSNSALIHYMTAGLMLIGFDDIWALKLSGGIPGIATVPLLYLLLRELFNRPAAAVGSALLAVSTWHVLDSRFGYAIAIDGLSVTAALYFFVRGLRTARHLDFAVAGLLLGWGMVMTRVAVMAPVLVAVLGLYLVLQVGWQRAQGFRTHALLLVLVTSAFFAPRALYIFQRGPTNALQRQEEVFLFSKSEWSDAKKNPVLRTAANAADYYLMFNYRAGTHSQWNARPAQPALDVATGALLVLGVAFALARLRSWPSAFLLSTVVVMILPGAITLATADHPLQHRAIGTIPAVFGLAAVPVWGLWEALRDRRARLALAAGAVALVGVAAYLNYQAYFVDYGNDIGAYYYTERPETWAAKELLRLKKEHQVYITTTELHAGVIDQLTRRHASYLALDGPEDLPALPPPEGEGLAFIVMTGLYRSDGVLAPTVLHLLRTYYPDGHILREEHDPAGELVGLSFAISEAALRAEPPP